jgi:glyoxylase-like metal-dependent hydrolase (beta-lactamase superfamily II)
VNHGLSAWWQLKIGARELARFGRFGLFGLIGPFAQFSLLLGLTGCAEWQALTQAPAPPPPTKARQAAADAEQVAPGVYMLRGAEGEVDTDNLGRVGNAGFIVGPTGVLVVDSGTSYRQGKALLDAIARVTPLPVHLLVLTHTRQEFLFGAAAFRERGVPIWMQRQAATLMAGRCDGCLRTLRRVLGDVEMAGSAVLKPDQQFDTSMALPLAGRPVRVLHFGYSSGPGDVVVLDETTGTLFAGGLLDNARIPDVQDSDLPGWTKALKDISAMPLQRIVPGHGPVSGAGAAGQTVAAVQRYLLQLQNSASALLNAGAALSEVPDKTQLPEFENWDQYDTVHRRNASVVFLRLERAQLAQKPD